MEAEQIVDIIKLSEDVDDRVEAQKRKAIFEDAKRAKRPTPFWKGNQAMGTYTVVSYNTAVITDTQSHQTTIHTTPMPVRTVNTGDSLTLTYKLDFK